MYGKFLANKVRHLPYRCPFSSAAGATQGEWATPLKMYGKFEICPTVAHFHWLRVRHKANGQLLCK
jgi:hypothetical protein